MKIAVCVILYNPGESVIQNIQSYINHVDKLYLIDNSESINTDLQKAYNALSNTIIVRNGINEGIAKRLNEACDLAINDEFDYLLTMDQDSYFDEESISKYLECLETNKAQNVSMYGINHQQEMTDLNCSYAEAKFLITSGSIINLRSYQQIGDFDENLFIDFVDTEYCFRSIQKGFKLIEFQHIFLNHSLGISITKRSLKNFKKNKRSFHSPVRLYYMMRNFLYLNSKYKNEFGKELLEHKKDILNRVKNNLVYASMSTRLKVFSFVLKGWCDFKKEKWGKIR